MRRCFLCAVLSDEDFQSGFRDEAWDLGDSQGSKIRRWRHSESCDQAHEAIRVRGLGLEGLARALETKFETSELGFVVRGLRRDISKYGIEMLKLRL